MALTQKSSLSLYQTAFEKLAYYALRPELYFMDLVDVRPSNLTNNGATVQFQLNSDLAAATTPLTETADITPVAMSDSNVTVTMLEYGNAVQTTAQARAFPYMPLNPIVANVIGFNAGTSLDTIARATFQAGTQVYLSGGVANRNLLTITGSTSLVGKEVTRAVAKLGGQNVQRFPNGAYRGIIHPDVVYDFKTVTGGTNWSDPHVYSDPSGIYNGVVGTFQGVTFMESPRAPLFADVGNGAGGAGTVDAYRTLILGRQAVAAAYSNGGGYTGGFGPTYVDIPEIDVLRRFDGTGWKALLGFAIFRQAAIFGIESSSTIGAN